jgi:hypothetical protein
VHAGGKAAAGKQLAKLRRMVTVRIDSPPVPCPVSSMTSEHSVEATPASAQLSSAAVQRGDVFLLGAGFSRAISESMPLLQDLAQHIAQKFKQASRIPTEVSAMMEENLAHALSYLEQAKPWLTEAENLRHRALFLEFSSVIARVLEEIVQDITRDVARAAPEWLKQLIRYWHDQRCTILTLNYDTLIEAVAASIQVNGSGVLKTQHLYPPLLTDAQLRSGMPSSSKRVETFRLLKLHGSTNWYYSGRTSAHGEPIYFVPPPDDTHAEEHAHRMRAVADKYPFLVPPIYDKSALFTHETIRALWFEAGESLKSAKRVVCMGYSLPESDLTMKHFLRTTLNANCDFQLVDPAERTIDNFKKILGRTRVRLEQTHSGPDCIRCFVEQLPQGKL